MSGSAAAVEVLGASKSYRVRKSRASSLKELALSPGARGGQTEVVKALDGVSLRVERGRSLAVVGANGSGKSTLLKLLAGIIEPDGGSVRVRGRVAGLLELGAGFQLEFTGMENIFLQGSLLGLARVEILARLDAIIAFSGVERFIHTPMRCYSSGMVVRLGFAIAVHARPDVLLVDEVLAVGDAAFQKQCLRAIDAFRAEGGTTLLVSHVPQHIERAADELLWLEDGRARLHGPMGAAFGEYLEALRPPEAERPADAPRLCIDPADAKRSSAIVSALSGAADFGGDAVVESWRILQGGVPRQAIDMAEPLSIEVSFRVLRDGLPVRIIAAFSGDGETRLAMPADDGAGPGAYPAGRHRAVLELEPLRWAPGRYALSLGLVDPGNHWASHDLRINAASFLALGASTGPSEAILASVGAFAP